MSGLLALANRYSLKLVEDCAQAHGAEYKGRRVGAIGDVGAFSFYPGKNLGAYGDAGAIITNDAELAKKCRMIANHGRIDKYNHLMEGRNSRLDGLQAAILSVKLRHLDGWIDRRNVIALRYLSGLKHLDGLTLPTVQNEVRHAFHLFVVRLTDRDGLRAHLDRCGVESGIHYPIALHKLAAYGYLKQASEPMFSSRADTEVLSLPLGEHLTDFDVDTVVDAVNSFFS
jgi:dTDP-4-amino-4,6-dideoxygalactose transaminase